MRRVAAGLGLRRWLCVLNLASERYLTSQPRLGVSIVSIEKGTLNHVSEYHENAADLIVPVKVYDRMQR